MMILPLRSITNSADVMVQIHFPPTSGGLTRAGSCPRRPAAHTHRFLSASSPSELRSQSQCWDELCAAGRAPKQSGPLPESALELNGAGFRLQDLLYLGHELDSSSPAQSSGTSRAAPSTKSDCSPRRSRIVTERERDWTCGAAVPGPPRRPTRTRPDLANRIESVTELLGATNGCQGVPLPPRAHAAPAGGARVQMAHRQHV
mmetsp:Transcript_106979/g.310636  ORF Transcript_106979/g.310636 Transcript_106979/m.310636 type:complete len:203 (-) Transcript_106979:1928-2536(-)